MFENDPHTRMEITAPSLMVMNVTYALLKDSMELLTLKNMDSYDPYNKPDTIRCAHVAHSPYYIYNDTGLDVEFVIGSYEDNSEFESGRSLVKSGEKKWLSPEHMNSAKMEAKALDRLSRVILVRVPAGSDSAPMLIKNPQNVRKSLRMFELSYTKLPKTKGSF